MSVLFIFQYQQSQTNIRCVFSCKDIGVKKGKREKKFLFFFGWHGKRKMLPCHNFHNLSFSSNNVIDNLYKFLPSLAISSLIILLIFTYHVTSTISLRICTSANNHRQSPTPNIKFKFSNLSFPTFNGPKSLHQIHPRWNKYKETVMPIEEKKLLTLTLTTIKLNLLQAPGDWCLNNLQLSTLQTWANSTPIRGLQRV